MKKLFLAFLILSIGIASCSKQGVEVAEVEKPLQVSISVNGSADSQIVPVTK